MHFAKVIQEDCGRVGIGVDMALTDSSSFYQQYCNLAGGLGTFHFCAFKI